MWSDQSEAPKGPALVTPQWTLVSWIYLIKVLMALCRLVLLCGCYNSVQLGLKGYKTQLGVFQRCFNFNGSHYTKDLRKCCRCDQQIKLSWLTLITAVQVYLYKIQTDLSSTSHNKSKLFQNLLILCIFCTYFVCLSHICLLFVFFSCEDQHTSKAAFSSALR